MKKILVTVLAALTVLAIAGCKGSDTNNTTKGSDTEQKTTEQAQAFDAAAVKASILEKVTFDKVKYPYVANCTAEYVDENTSSGYIKELLSKQVYSSVRFEQSVRKMIADGYDTFVEVGPGKTLSGFVKKIAKSMEKEVVIK